MTLSLRFGLLAIGLLLTAMLAAGYLFERQHIEALETNERQHVQMRAERAADDLQRQFDRLCNDTRFLAHSPPLLELRHALREMPWQELEDAPFAPLYAELETLLLAFGRAHPEYLQLRLIGVDDGGRELVRVDRRDGQLTALDPQSLQQKGHRYYVREALGLGEDQVYFSRIDLNRERYGIDMPETPTLRAASPISNADGSVFALLVVNLDMQAVLERIQRHRAAVGQMFLANEEGYFLYHPDPRKAFTFDRGDAYRLEQAFPRQAETISWASPAAGVHFDLGSGDSAALGYAAVRRLGAPEGPGERRVTLIMSEPALHARREIAEIRRRTHLVMTLLLGTAVLFAVFMANRLTRSLRGMVRASEALAQGRYDVELPPSTDRDLASVCNAFRHMVSTLRQREQAMGRLNEDLERQVGERTRDLDASRAVLAQEQALLKAILDSVGDGVVAVDAEGRFLLWNRSAREMIGVEPKDLPPQAWPEHFGLYRSSAGDLMPMAELPLIKALRGERVHEQEVLVRNAANPDGRWINVLARPLENGISIQRGAVAVLIDLQENRLLREQREARSQELRRIGRLTLIGQIVDTATHKLSQPLAAISNYAGAAIQLRSVGRLDDRRLDEILNHIIRMADRGGESLEALRALTLREDRRYEEVDLNELARASLGLLKDRIQRQKIDVEQALAKDLPTLFGQRAELQQALVHLLVNALEALASADGENRRLRLATVCDAQRRRVSIEVADNGPGIPPELREHIFEPWFTTKPDAPGLGLAVASSIADTHNGKLCMAPTEDGLTRFVIDLPVLDEHHD